MKRILSVLICFITVVNLMFPVMAAKNDNLSDIMSETARYLYSAVPDPQSGSVGGEWLVFALLRSGADIPTGYCEKYYNNLKEYISLCDGVLHKRKYTEYSRVILALSAMGKDPSDVAGYNLVLPLGDFEKTVAQGINGAAWALIALDCRDYDIPANCDAKIQATREMYLEYILERQLSDGGWALAGDVSEADITAMILQALSNYLSDEKVSGAVSKALECMSHMQNDTGGFSVGEQRTSESSIQMLIALCELNIPLSDKRFVKNGNTVLDNLLSFYNKDGGFRHSDNAKESDLMATEQALYALAAVKRATTGMPGLYCMDDVSYTSFSDKQIFGLEGKNDDIKKSVVADSQKTFADIINHPQKANIEALAQRNIINGKNENEFKPDDTMTRAEFATIITKGLGLLKKGTIEFSDVSPEDWFYDYILAGYHYGIIKGVSEDKFNPYGRIKREEAAVMVARTAALCGVNTEYVSAYQRDVLSGFIDYVNVSDWALNSLAFCYDKKILDDGVIEIKPKEFVTRAEIAGMLYNILNIAKLL